jgi:hypothetical protein
MERPPNRHLRAVGYNSRLSDEQSERDADRDRGQQAHDDENDESKHHRRVALSGACWLGAPHNRALGRPQR